MIRVMRSKFTFTVDFLLIIALSRQESVTQVVRGDQTALRLSR
jgi:hypothetical protein